MSLNNSMPKPEVDQIGQVEEHEHHVAVHTDTFDIAEEALGIDLPKNYWRSPAFVGTVLVWNNLHSGRRGLRLLTFLGVGLRVYLQ